MELLKNLLRKNIFFVLTPTPTVESNINVRYLYDMPNKRDSSKEG